MNTKIFEKNINGLSGAEYKSLKEKLLNYKELRKFSFSIGSDPLDINIIRKKDLKKMFDNPIKELNEKLDFFNDKYVRYPSLFFYGIGNGIFYKALLANKTHQRIVVFEEELELIYIVFNFIDFSFELSQGRFIIILNEEYNNTRAINLFSISGIVLFLKLYNLHLFNDFYKIYKDEIKNINFINSKAIKNVALRQGNDPADAMQGMEQFVYNLPKMISHPSYDILKKTRSKKSKTAIIVGTGPSLTKQLPTLKEYQNKATIFCADSAYPILAKEGIKPDYVCMLERDEVVSECFNNDFGEFDKDILFICASLVHKKTIEYLERNNRTYMLIPRGLHFPMSLDLKGYGYISGGFSVSHMMLELAIALSYKIVALIGQDLAYGKDGNSHSKGFIHSSYHDGHYERDFNKFNLVAYGGNGFVQSSMVWNLFKDVFESMINNNKNISIYNCTEGGARIEGSIEKPFNYFCEEFVKNDIKKHLCKLKKNKKNEQILLMLDIYKKIKKFMKLSDNFINFSKKVHRQISSIKRKKQTYTLHEIFKSIDQVKDKLENPKYMFLREPLSPTLYHQEMQFNNLFAQDIKNDSDKQNKMIAWIYAHEAWIEDIINIAIIQNAKLKMSIMPLQDILEKKNLI